MPVLKHAKKKLRQDIKRTQENKRVKNLFKMLIKKAKEDPNSETISSAYKAIDKAAKINVIHENKAARLKSSVVKQTNGETTPAKALPKKKLTKAARAKANKAATAKAKAMKPSTTSRRAV